MKQRIEDTAERMMLALECFNGNKFEDDTSEQVKQDLNSIREEYRKLNNSSFTESRRRAIKKYFESVLTELLSNAEGEVKEFDEDVVIIYMQNKPYGIRNKNGFLLFFPPITKYDGQEDRYGQEVQEQIDLATKILHCIASQPTSKGESA